MRVRQISERGTDLPMSLWTWDRDGTDVAHTIGDRYMSYNR